LKGSFSEAAQTLSLIKEANQNLNVIGENEKEQFSQNLKEKLTEIFESWSEHIKNAIENLKPGPQDQVAQAISSFQDQWQLLK